MNPQHEQLRSALRKYSFEHVGRSWFELILALTVWIVLVSSGVKSENVFAKFVLCTIGGMSMVRIFIMFHDHAHGSFLPKNPIAHGILYLFGLYTLVPFSIWKYSHNFHHANNTHMPKEYIGGYPLMTLSQWKEASPAKRLQYQFTRHPLTILFGYVTVFFLGMCIIPLVASPKRNMDSLYAIIFHFGIMTGLTVWNQSFTVAFFAVVWPMFVSAAMGAGLFYVQHCFDGMEVFEGEEWNLTDAALKSSSFLDLPAPLAWLTGNIGYHHVHHLSAAIPFYRLPAAHAEIPQLQQAKVVKLTVADIVGAFQSNLWDSEQQKMVPFPKEKSINLHGM